MTPKEMRSAEDDLSLLMQMARDLREKHSPEHKRVDRARRVYDNHLIEIEESIRRAMTVVGLVMDYENALEARRSGS